MVRVLREEKERERERERERGRGGGEREREREGEREGEGGGGRERERESSQSPHQPIHAVTIEKHPAITRTSTYPNLISRGKCKRKRGSKKNVWGILGNLQEGTH